MKFKKGDKVCKKDGTSFSNGWYVLTVKGYYGDCVEFEETGTTLTERTLQLQNQEKLTPHKHAELIKAWADGHKIQYFSEGLNKWATTKTPSWHIGSKYRIKPDGNHEAIEQIELEMRKLADKLAKLKAE